MRLATEHSLTIEDDGFGGAAIPADDALDPSLVVADATTADGMTFAPPPATEDFLPPRGVIVVVRIKQADGSWRTNGTVTYRLWEREHRAADAAVLGGYVPYEAAAGTTHTQAVTQAPRRLTDILPPTRFYAQVLAVGGGVAIGDVISFAAAVL